jgi:hypothetical protein
MALLLSLSQPAQAQEKANTTCIWGLFKVIQAFERICHSDEQSDYRTALDESVTLLEKRTQELGMVQDFETVVDKPSKLFKDLLDREPDQCRQGHIFQMAQQARAKGVEKLRAEIARIVAVTRENQLTGCL